MYRESLQGNQEARGISQNIDGTQEICMKFKQYFHELFN